MCQTFNESFRQFGKASQGKRNFFRVEISIPHPVKTTKDVAHVFVKLVSEFAKLGISQHCDGRFAICPFHQATHTTSIGVHQDKHSVGYGFFF